MLQNWLMPQLTEHVIAFIFEQEEALRLRIFTGVFENS
jgi:hypothetical protein